MAYLAINDIIGNSLVPFGTYTSFIGVWEHGFKHGKTLCIVQDHIYLAANGSSYVSHFALAVDR